MSGIIFPEGSTPSTPASGNVELYAKTDSLLYYLNDAGNETRISGPVIGTYTSLSGTSTTLSGIPSGVTQIIISIVSASTNGTSGLAVQIGDSGGLETTGYVGVAMQGASGGNTLASATNSFLITNAMVATENYTGQVRLTLADSSTNLWVNSSNLIREDGAATYTGGGRKALSSTLDRIAVTTTGGANTFDAGSINIWYA